MTFNYFQKLFKAILSCHFVVGKINCTILLGNFLKIFEIPEKKYFFSRKKSRVFLQPCNLG